MAFPINVPVQGAQKIYGESALVVVNPLSRRVTHLVVTEDWMVRWQRLVPIEWVQSVTREAIRLDCTPAEFEALPLFMAGEFLFPNPDEPEGRLLAELNVEAGCLWPLLVTPPDLASPAAIALANLGVHRGMSVCATNGLVGQVAYLLVAPGTESVTHLYVETGTPRSYLMPITVIQRVEAYTVHLTISKQEALHFTTDRLTGAF